MIIDLSILRLTVKEKVNDLIFESRMQKAHNKQMYPASATLACGIITENCQVLLPTGAENISSENINAIIFAACEVLKQTCYYLPMVKASIYVGVHRKKIC